jgi:hypothetical protein
LTGLTGLGGVGKTQLVVEYIHRFRQAYPGGVFWINAADGLDEGFAAIGHILIQDGREKYNSELVQIAADYLRSDPDTLLVLVVDPHGEIMEHELNSPFVYLRSLVQGVSTPGNGQGGSEQPPQRVYEFDTTSGNSENVESLWLVCVLNRGEG